MTPLDPSNLPEVDSEGLAPIASRPAVPAVLDDRAPPFRLLRYFSLASFVAMTVAALALGAFFRQVEMNNVLRLGESQNIALTRAFANSMWPVISGFLKEGKPVTRGHPLSPHLDQELSVLIKDLAVVKIKIFDTHGLTIYSTDPRQSGEDQAKNIGVQAALKGKVTNNLIHRKGVPSFDGVVEDRDLISTYVPVYRAGEVRGVFELYYDVTPVLERMNATQQRVTGMVGLLFVVLYGILHVIVRRADRIMREQRLQLNRFVDEIEAMNDTLERRVKDRTEVLRITNKVLKQEILERQQAEAELRKLTGAVEQSPVSVVITDAMGQIEYVNPKFCEVTGYSREEALGKNPSLLKSGESLPEAYREMWRVISNGGVWRGEFHNRRRDGGLFWEMATISPVRNKAGRITHYLAVKEDITQRKLHEKALEDARRHSFQQEKMAAVGTLAAGIVHEIGNPIMAISGLVEELRDMTHDAEAINFLEMIREQINRLSGITRDVSAFSMPQMDEPQLLDLNGLVEGAMRLMRFDRRMRQIERRQDLDRELSAVMGSDNQLRQVLINLMINAADALEGVQDRPREIVVSTTRDGEGRVRLTVADNGVGMDPETRSRALDAFFTTKPVGRGTGLGLSLCYSIVSEHHGSLEIESEPGVGTKVHIVLPAGDDG
ncbi:MAG: PAS domain S-box protein [Magnetococcales bacterium]|nr:PAS domain S-box protein [Magnetococcales bacterium]